MTTLGSMIGVLTDNFAITNDDQDKVQLSVRWDFRTATDADIKSWLCGNRRIAFQRPSRAMSVDELTTVDGSTIPAIDAGKKVKTHAEKIAAIVNVGIPEELAEFALENPVKLDEIMALVNAAKDDNDND